jgi:hypothetical protein
MDKKEIRPIAILLLIMLMLGFAMWANCHNHSDSGMLSAPPPENVYLTSK